MANPSIRRSLATRTRRRDHGQGLVEFALVLPIFLLLIFGVIDGGRYVYVNSTLSNAAREGARLGSVEASWRGSTDPSCGKAGGPVCPANNTVLVQHITAAANRQMAPFGAVDNVYLRCVGGTGTPPTGQWTGVSCGSNAAGGYLSIRVTFTWSAMTPMIGNIMGDITSSASATVFIN
jgi:Flp pilus assembly protein TadG